MTDREALVNGLSWRMIGPHRGGRSVAVAGDSRNPQVFYFGACAGGVWKTTDGGITWRNVSDGFFNTAAIGALAVSESDPNVIYAGTGETSIRGNVSHGDGVYKSTNGGKTWRHLGLVDTRHIGKIQIHPTNPDIVYLAALGHAYGPNEERGVYRSTNGGETWDRVLHRGPTAGSHDISMDLTNPRILFAAIWQVQRYPHTLNSGGELSGLFRTSNGGETWQEITRNPGLPKGTLGKLGVAASRAKPGRVWALIEAEDGAMFRSDDGGDTWTRGSEEPLLRTRPWYYMHVTADTTDPDTLYVQNYGLWRSIDAGLTFTKMTTPHGDEHALWIDPRDHSRMIDGNDGGACVSFNYGGTWSTIYNQPTAQLYHVTTDDQFPYRVYGSQQDNTAITVPSATMHASIHERTWYAPGGGESGYIAIKPDEPWHVVASGPVGRRAYNDIMTHYDNRTGQIRDITVWPELYGWGAGAESLKYRLQWTFPILFSRHAPHDLYVAGNRLFKSSDLGSSFDVVSPDLTRNDPDKLKPSGGAITRDNTGAEVYCTIFALAESPRVPGTFWAGTDDGLVHISEDFGNTWTAITPPELPEWALISIIEVSPHQEGCAYLAATRYKHDDTAPYLFKTTDNGASWTSITNGIPATDFTRVVREDPNCRGLLYAGTESGIYASFDDGDNWTRLGGNFPVVPVYDLIIKGVEMVVATHGRSFWILDDLTPFHELAKKAATSQGSRLFTPRSRERVRRYLGWGDDPYWGVVNYGQADVSLTHFDPIVRPDGTVGSKFLDAGENPPDGIVVQYLLPESEDLDVSLTFLDSAGLEIRRFSGDPDGAPPRVPAAAGLNSFTWNLRYPGATAVTSKRLSVWDRPSGPMAVPGGYQVRLTVNGASETRTFQVLPDPRLETPHEALVAQRDFLLELVDRLSRTNTAINSIERLIGQIEFWVERSDEASVSESALHLRTSLERMLNELIDVNMKGSQLYPSELHEKFNAMLDSVDGSDYAPPKQAREVETMLTRQLERLENELYDLEEGSIADFCQEIATTGLPAIGIN